MPKDEILYIQEQLKKVWGMHPKNWSKYKVRIVWDFVNRAAQGDRFCVECVAEDGYECSRGEKEFPIYMEKSRVIVGHIRHAIQTKRLMDLPVGKKSGKEERAWFMALGECQRHDRSKVYGIIETPKEFVSVDMQENQVISGHLRNQERRNETATAMFPEQVMMKKMTVDITKLSLPEGR